METCTQPPDGDTSPQEPDNFGMPNSEGRRAVRGRTPGGRMLDAGLARVLRLPPGDRDYSVVRDVRVPMRDGVELLTDVYRPLGASLGTVLVRTPYGRRGLISALTANTYASHGYTVVNQSCRGTFGSGGLFEPFVREVDDGADTVSWLRKQTWFGGRFALVGASYLGFTAWAILMDPPPELATAVIAITAHDNHWVVHGAGAFSLEQVLGLHDAFDHIEDGVVRSMVHLAGARGRLRRAFEELPLVWAADTVLANGSMAYREWLTTPDANDPMWRPMRLGEALERVSVPVLLHEGWQDRFVEQMLDEYEHLRRRGVDVALTVGPWTHVESATKGWGLLLQESLDWLAEHLAGTGSRRRLSPVRVFVTGADEWRWLSRWPPAGDQYVLHLQPHGALAEAAPSSTAAPSTFRYDPASPTPAVGGRVVNPAMGGRRDNRSLERRADVLTFTGPPLAEPLEIAGRPVVELAHQSDNPHVDLFVRLCEVTKGGRSTNLSDGFCRLQPERSSGVVVVQLEAVAHRFEAGSRLRLQISGGAHPRFARNLGTGEDPATGTRLAASWRTINHGAGGYSRVLLPRAFTRNGQSD